MLLTSESQIKSLSHPHAVAKNSQGSCKHSKMSIECGSIRCGQQDAANQHDEGCDAGAVPSSKLISDVAHGEHASDDTTDFRVRHGFDYAMRTGRLGFPAVRVLRLEQTFNTHGKRVFQPGNRPGYPEDGAIPALTLEITNRKQDIGLGKHAKAMQPPMTPHR
jgi:hypothetical protein